MIFKEPDCASFSYRLDPGEYPDLSEVKHETVNFQGSQSFRPCSAGEGGVPVNIDIYGHAMTLDGSEHHEGLCNDILFRNPKIKVDNFTNLKRF